VASLWEVFRATLQRLHTTQPQSERWLFGLGDAAYEVGQFRDAVRYVIKPHTLACVLLWLTLNRTGTTYWEEALTTRSTAIPPHPSP
jgi:hypothetical protein